MRLMEIIRSFTLDPAADSENYSITSSLRDVSSWKAKILLGNNTDKDVGEWDDVRYVMISLVDDTIVPIALGDEHHTGYDLIRHLGLEARDFYPVTATSNYIFRVDEVPRALTAFRKWLDWGGKDSMIESTAGSSLNFKIHLSDFLASDGKYRSEKGKLAPTGEKVVSLFEKLASDIRTAMSVGVANDRQVRTAFRTARTLISFLTENHEIDRDYAFFNRVGEEFRDREKDLDITWLEDVFFGFPSIKNSIHVRLKAVKSPYNQKMDEKIWGDVQLAIHRLGDI